MSTEATTPGAVPLDGAVRPVAEVKCGRLGWAIPSADYKLADKFLNNDTHPLYDQDALDAAVAAERGKMIAAVGALHMAQTINHQNYPGAWHDGVDAAIDALREA